MKPKDILMIVVACIVGMVCVMALMVTAGNTATYYGNDDYSRSVRNECEKNTSTRTLTGHRLNIPQAKQCFLMVLDIHQSQRLEQSFINRNNAEADWYRDHTRPRHRNKSRGN